FFLERSGTGVSFSVSHSATLRSERCWHARCNAPAHAAGPDSQRRSFLAQRRGPGADRARSARSAARGPASRARAVVHGARQPRRAALHRGDEGAAGGAAARLGGAGAQGDLCAGARAAAAGARLGPGGADVGQARSPQSRGILGGPAQRPPPGAAQRPHCQGRHHAVLGHPPRGIRARASPRRAGNRLRPQPPFRRSHAFGRRPPPGAAARRGGARARAARGRSPGAGAVRRAQRRRRAVSAGFTRSARGRGVRRGEMELVEALKEHFGYETFRKGQEAIVRSVLSGRPTIAILPTGGGKSLCYQLPALLLEGTSVVVSPLVALMKDQVDALRARGIAATFVNSSLPESERQDRQAALRRGEYRLVYVAPERFKSPSFLSAMAELTVPLLAVDEAHCISAWGHDFRPEYQQLARAREQVRAERVLALTATATPEVRRDIADALELRDPKVFVAGFDRPNLFIEVLRVSGDKDKLGRLVALSRSGGPGIVYAATRKNVEKVVGALRASGIDAIGYHAGMADADRTAAQERFVRRDAPVIVATNAFGMGVDKADIRFVAHFDVPRSL